MAKITINLEDCDDGSVNVKIDSDPPLPMKDGNVDLSKTTPAHDTLVIMMNAATDEEQGAEVESVDIQTELGTIHATKEV